MNAPSPQRVLILFANSIVCVLLTSLIAYAQVRRELIVSPKVGTEIDSVERKAYGLFPNVDDFQAAIFYEAADRTILSLL